MPRFSDEKKIAIYDRASHFRRINDYDRASLLFEQLILDDNTQADVYWSLALCKYGVEYVVDYNTGKRIPTINRANQESIYDDYDYKKAIEYGNKEQKEIFEAEAKVINNLQKKILEISAKEEPYDIFICYKENDDKGQRTEDSLIAQNLYNILTNEGYRVFFSRISLGDKLGKNYEPYIYAALNSAKAMLLVSTAIENVESTWVKNEWSRYLAITKKNNNKFLIPVYKYIGMKDFPSELSMLQGQDASKLGYEQDIIYGLEKILRNSKKYLINNSKIENKRKRINIVPIIIIVVLAALVVLGVSIYLNNRVTIIDDIKNAEVGSIVKFGKYEQDNKTNGKEKIEWIVLDKNNDYAILLSKYVLDSQSYSNDNSYVSWDESFLKQWIENEFYNEAFSSKEKNYISESKVSLLSIDQTKKYLDSVSARSAVATDYAIAKGLKTSSTYGNCEWWIIPSNSISHFASKVKDNGSISAKADNISESSGVRPMIVIAHLSN